MPDQETQPPAHSELASFGEELRREREIRGISLKEIADATKISKRFLEAIERNDHRTLPAPVFTRGFVREYARYLGLNAEEIVNRYNFAAAGDDRIEKPRFEPVAPQPVRELTKKQPSKRGIPPPYARVDRNILLLVLIALALGSVSWWAIQHRRFDFDSAKTDAGPAIIVPAKPAPSPAPVVPAPAAAAQDDLLHLTLDLTGNSWVTLEADGKTVVNDELRSGEHRTYEAKDEFRFRTIGNAAGVGLTLNGIKLPVLGGDGEVIKNKTYDRDALEEMKSDQPRSET
ncbi:MAG TPA: helix-turn-helix domain-containing protein [Thermoanaerobaculia bacterium]|nr:helix-turn-helix domain-containing protein [Thermoanaerobaculia bacterium]